MMQVLADVADLKVAHVEMGVKLNLFQQNLDANTELTQKTYDETLLVVNAVRWVEGAQLWWAKWIRRTAWVSKYVVIPICGAIVALYGVAEQAAHFDIGHWIGTLWRKA